MKRIKSHFLAFLALTAVLTFSNCLHIVEEVSFKNNGAGTYRLNMDMSEVKSMMEMMKGMQTDSTGAGGEEAGQGNEMTQMGEQLTGVSESLKGVQGITNVKEIKDTTTFQFGYTFDFQDVAALNRAMKIIGKEKFETKTGDVFKLDGKKFERLAAADMGAELKKALGQAGESEEEGMEDQMDMLKMFFADMTYKQVYHFERKVKKSSNELSELSDEDQTVTITLKPFDEEQQKKNVGVATAIKLK